MSLRDEPLELAEALLKAYATQIDEFVAVSRRFCDTLEARNSLTQVGFLQAMESLIAELYFRAIGLPDSDLWFSDDEDDDDVPAEAEPEAKPTSKQTEITLEELRQQHEEEFPILAASTVSPEDQFQIAAEIAEKLGDYDSYLKVFNPFGDTEAIQGTLSDDLSSAYTDLKTSLLLFETGATAAKREAVWDWRFQFDIHWGDHLTSAQRAIQALLRRERFSWDDDAWNRGRLVRSKLKQ